MFRTGIDSFNDEKISSISVLSTIFEVFYEHDPLIYLEEWRGTATFKTYSVEKPLKNASYFLRKTDGVIIT